MGSPTRPAYLTDPIETLLKMNTRAISDFLKQEDGLPVWEPPASFDGAASWTVHEIDRLTAKKLPALIQRDRSRRYVPDMLLYQLGNLQTLDDAFQERLLEVVAGKDHVFISNASGTGKTRLLFEILASHWGFYFTCTSDAVVDPYGSIDLGEALRATDQTHIGGVGLNYEIPFPQRLSARWRATVDRNRAIARRLINPVILARLIVFQHFCSIVQESGITEDRARLKWFLIQLCPRTISMTADIFSAIAVHVRLLGDAEIATHIRSLYPQLSSRIGFVAVDEANVAMEAFPEAFMTANCRRRVPYLRELVYCMADCHPGSRLMVAGTLLDEAVVSEPLEAASCRIHSLRVFHALGSFDTVQRTTHYLRHFLDDAVSDVECKTIHMWLQGRHRFLAVFVRYTLQYGKDRMTGVLDSIVQRFTGHRRSETYPFGRVEIGLAFSDDNLEELEPPVARSLRAATLNYALHGCATSFDAHSRALVGMGAALYGPDVSVARIHEPLIILNLARWLPKSPGYGVLGLVKQKIDDATLPLRDTGFIEGLAACVRDIFGGPEDVSLAAALDFGGRAPPWAHGAARLLLPQLARRRTPFAPYTYSTDTSIQMAESPDDVFHWLDGAARPLLIPDAAFGAALLCVVGLAGGQKLLLAVDARVLRAEPGAALRTRHLVPLRADEFYREDAESRARLFSALARFAPTPAAGSPSKYNMLQLQCFARPYRAGTSYDPPAATLDAAFLLRQPRPTEFEMAQVLAHIGGS